MGQKVSPTGLRIGVNKDWESKWMAPKKDFAKYLANDVKIRSYLEKNLKDALETIDQFAPFGEGNPEIRVFVPDFTIIPQKGIYKKLIGIDGVRMTGNEFTVLGFGLADQLSETQEPTKAAMVVSLNKNYFNGNIYPQAEIKNITITDSLDKQRENPTPFKDALKAMADMRK